MVISYYTITALINFLTSVALAVLVFLKDRKNPKNISFFILASLVGFWNLSYFFWQNVTNSESLALFWCRALMIFTIMIPAAYFHFVLAVTGLLEKRRKLMVAVYLIFYFFMLTDATPFFIQKVEPIMNFKYWPMATPIMSIWFVCFGICVSYSAYLLVKKYWESTGITKLQLKYVSIGTIIAFICGTMNFVPWYKIPIPPVTHGLVPIYVVLMAYAITRYRLMDIKTIIRNIVFYLVITFFVFTFFYLVLYTYKFLFGDVFSIGGYIMGLFIAPIFAVFIYNSSRLLSSFMDKRVFYFIYVYKKTREEAEAELSRCVNLEKIADVVINAIQKTLQSEKIALLVLDKTNIKNKFIIVKKTGFAREEISNLDCELFSRYFKTKPEIITREELEQTILEAKDMDYKSMLHSIENQIHQSNISVCVPLMNAGSLVGMIIIGTKMYENPYSGDDFKLLENLSSHAGISIDNALLYKKLETENQRKKK